MILIGLFAITLTAAQANIKCVIHMTTDDCVQVCTVRECDNGYLKKDCTALHCHVESEDEYTEQNKLDSYAVPWIWKKRAAEFDDKETFESYKEEENSSTE